MRERKADQKEHDGEQRRERHGVDKLVLATKIAGQRLVEKTHPFLFYMANITLFKIFTFSGVKIRGKTYICILVYERTRENITLVEQLTRQILTIIIINNLLIHCL